MAKIFYQTQMPELLKALEKYGRVVAPIVRHPHSGVSKVVFDEIRLGEQPELGYSATVLSPKEFFRPAEEVVFELKGGKTVPVKPEPTVILGVSYDDLEAITRLKQIFNRPVSDEVFAARAKQTIVIAADRFSPPKNISFDIYLQKLSADRFAAFAGSAVGQKILKSPAFALERVSIPRVVKREVGQPSAQLVARAIRASKKSKIWDRVSEKCFSCGICTYVCPLCYCFETEDRVPLGEDENRNVRRVRRESTCLSSNFAATGAGNFRPARRDQLYNWYFHKFVRMESEYGFSGCVDCNRCTIFCPAKISYREVISEVVADYQKKGKK